MSSTNHKSKIKEEVFSGNNDESYIKRNCLMDTYHCS